MDGHTAPCPEEQLIGERAARRQLLERLEVDGTSEVPFFVQLASLRESNNPEMRQQVVRMIRGRQAPAVWLGESIGLARVYPDFWTAGTQPAAILLRNGEAQPRAHDLLVASGREHEFPLSFFVQDEETAREYVFSAPGLLSVDLGEVEPGAERLFVVWSDGFWTDEKQRRLRGVRLLMSGSWLRGLLRDERAEEWRRAAALILERRLPITRLDDHCLATNVHGDLWTRGSEPAGLAVRSAGGRPLSRRLVLRSGKGHEFPLRVHLHDAGRSREYVFDRRAALEDEIARAREVDWYEHSPIVLAAYDPELYAAWASTIYYDPRPYLERLEVPLLAVFGETDINVPAGRSAAVLEELAVDPRRDITVVVFEDIGQQLQSWRAWHRIGFLYLDEMADFAAAAVDRRADG